MKKATLLGLMALALGVSGAGATPINITVSAAGVLPGRYLHSPTGIADNTEYGQANKNPASNLVFLNTMIANWNTDPAGADPALSPVMPAAGVLALDQGSLGDGGSYSGPTGYQYVVFHFGAGQAGGGQVSPGGWWQAYFLGGDAISLAAVPQVQSLKTTGHVGTGKDKVDCTVASPCTVSDSVGGFSSARYFGTVSSTTGGGSSGGGTVPDGGMTMSLLGLGLAGMGLMKRLWK